MLIMNLSIVLLTIWCVFIECALLPKKFLLNKVLDFRSDTVTKPTSLMRDAMFQAEVGDDVFQEDPSVNKLEERIAKMMGKEAALLFPTGTMSNLAAAMTWCNKRGSEMILGELSHIHIYEQGGVSQIGGIATHILPNKADGTMNYDSIEAAIRANNIHYPTTDLIAIENTHNYCGGKVLPQKFVEEVGSLGKRKNIPIHLDGARIWNAATASKLSVAKLVEPVDSVTVCLSKGLGAPAGSLLVGSQDYITKARRLRKVLGGGMRQVGILAAAGLQALDDFEQGILEHDHKRAKYLAKELSKWKCYSVNEDEVETNMIVLKLVVPGYNADKLITMLQEKGLLVLPRGNHAIRIVIHRDLTEEDIEKAVQIFDEIAEEVLLPALPPNPLTPMIGQEQEEIIKHVLNNVSTEELIEKRLENMISNLPTIDLSSPETIKSQSNEINEPLIEPVKEQENVELINETKEEPVIKEDITNSDINSLQLFSNSTKQMIFSTDNQYEPVEIYAMSVSDEGFCVFLKSLLSDQIVKILVPPLDPLVYGLDSDQVESSEAVTLLQLYQDIDVETVLPKDILSTLFGDQKAKYKLKRVLIENIDIKNKFQGYLIGFPRKSQQFINNSTTESFTDIDRTLIQQLFQLIGIEPSNNHPSNQTIASMLSQIHDFSQLIPLTQEIIQCISTYLSDVTHQDILGNPYLKQVEIKHAFYAIALALRHKSSIEVKKSYFTSLINTTPSLEVENQTSTSTTSSSTTSLPPSSDSTNNNPLVPIYTIEQLRNEFPRLLESPTNPQESIHKKTLVFHKHLIYYLEYFLHQIHNNIQLEKKHTKESNEMIETWKQLIAYLYEKINVIPLSVDNNNNNNEETNPVIDPNNSSNESLKNNFDDAQYNI